MCKVRDVALSMLKKSIDVATTKNDRRYLMDYVKLHKMLYLGQCMLLGKYDLRLFEEPINAHNCGPYIEDALNFIFNNYGTELIERLEYDDGQRPVVLDLPYLRNEIVDFLIEKYGHFSTADMVAFTKRTDAYMCYKGSYDQHPVISQDEMKAVGKRLI